MAQEFKLTNALVVGQLDKEDDRYALEANLVDLLTEEGIKAFPSMNVLKTGESGENLTNDSVKQILQGKGIDTYILVSVRGYDKRFKKPSKGEVLDTALTIGHLYPLYRDDIVSITFEFLFYRNGVYLGSDLVKCGNVSDRDAVIKRFRKKVGKRIAKKWKK